MSRKVTQVPDAWEDDDWETQADKAATTVSPNKPQQSSASQPQQPVAVLSRAERLAQHAESNRKLWESAEAPPASEPHHYLMTAQSDPPLTTPFKPAVKVLSRRPAKQMVQKRDPVTGLSQMTLEDDDDDDESKKGPQLTPDEIRAKQQREREEKQRRYEETRAKIFGTASPSASGTPADSQASSSGASTPGTTTPPSGRMGLDGSGGSVGGRGGRGRGRGRGRGGYYNNNYGHNHNNGHGHHGYNQNYNHNNSGYNSPHHNYNSPGSNPNYGFDGSGRGGGGGIMVDGGRDRDMIRQPMQPSRELYDPNYSPRSVPQQQQNQASTAGQLHHHSSSGSNSNSRGSNYNNHGGAPLYPTPSAPSSPAGGGMRAREEDQIIRKPRGPDGGSRAGFGFAGRGGRGAGAGAGGGRGS